MNKNPDVNFSGVEYRLIDEFNNESEEENETSNKLPEKIDESLYLSAMDSKEKADNLQLNIKSKSSRKRTHDKNPLLNATMYNKRNSDNHNNKYVDGSTLNSYLSINDLKQETHDNVDILRSNISKLTERGDHLGRLEEQSNFLAEGAQKFNSKSKYLRNKMFWANIMNLLLIGFFIFLIVFLIIKLT